MVAGCDCPSPSFGIERKTCCPGLHFLIRGDAMRILVTSPGSSVIVAFAGFALTYV